MTTHDGGPAFPTTDYYDEKPIGMTYGMSLRDYFAGQAMQGLLVASTEALNNSAACAQWAYEYADAMLTERAKT